MILAGAVGATEIRIEDTSAIIKFIQTKDYVSFLKGDLSAEDFISRIRFVNTAPIVSPPLPQPNTPVAKEVPSLYSNDGKTFLGKLTSNTFDSDSVFNEFGDYGSEFSSKSIWNEFSDYGSEFSDKSAFNKFATKPPIIVLSGKTVGYLTINSTIKNAISPVGLLEYAKKQGY